VNAVSQLRIYRIKEGRMEEWLAGWKRGVLPLRRKLGFRIEGGVGGPRRRHLRLDPHV